MKPIKSTLFNMIAALLAVAVLSAAALGYVYQITKEPIARAKDQKTLDAIREVVGLSTTIRLPKKQPSPPPTENPNSNFTRRGKTALSPQLQSKPSPTTVSAAESN